MNQLKLQNTFENLIVKIGVTLIAGISSSLLLSSPIYAGTLNKNLIVNGDAEQGQGDPIGNAVGANIPAIPGWTLTGSFSVLQYGAKGFDFTTPSGQPVSVGGLPDATSPGPVNRGKNLFYGGGDRGSSSASQLINVADIASIIDKGKGAFNLSGWLGGYTTDLDSAQLDISFLGQDNKSLGKASIISYTPEQRNNQTGLFFQSNKGVVPVGTKSINVVLNANYVRGRVNDAYADNLSLVVTKVPEPSSGFFLIGTCSVMVWGLRRKRC
ncbi:PEP-CTERM sorting domain-containing protein [Hassallia byssoidea VB512170]|uniref:PEP-CTERM sorting domain-containing protein n=1 Tax=Hassallia byssoidea VB512170 TaxID=1304833 RepID=A0A846H5S5_9CYAN|nr:hypothetical protein [Hassalia byssoidea]NEU72318.1 PEP-CTERM sorting domain-containing protein [Hassalia byssoidea VB512170]